MWTTIECKVTGAQLCTYKEIRCTVHSSSTMTQHSYMPQALVYTELFYRDPSRAFLAVIQTELPRHTVTPSKVHRGTCRSKSVLTTWCFPFFLSICCRPPRPVYLQPCDMHSFSTPMLCPLNTATHHAANTRKVKTTPIAAPSINLKAPPLTILALSQSAER